MFTLPLFARPLRALMLGVLVIAGCAPPDEPGIDPDSLEGSPTPLLNVNGPKDRLNFLQFVKANGILYLRGSRVNRKKVTAL